MSARKQAALVLAQVIADGRSLDGLLTALPLAGQDISLCKELCFGTLRWYFQLNALLKPFLNKPLRQQDQDIHALLLIGLYQLRFSRIPPHAAVAQTVNAAHELKKPWAAKLVNAVLRRFQAQAPMPQADDLEAHYAHPLWLIQHLQHAWPEHWTQILTANNQRPPLWLRANARKISRDDYLALLAQEGMEAQASPHAPQGIHVLTPRPVNELPRFKEGWVSVQDASAQLAANLLTPQAGFQVLDACAAPGGKAAHLLEIEPKINLLAVDQSAQRLAKMQTDYQRLGLQTECLALDACELGAHLNGRLFDRILLDAPCSGSGVIRRHPDIKLLRRESDIAELATRQAKLLQALWPLLKPNGILVYATCSVLPEENDQVISRFCAQRADAKLLPIQAEWGLALTYGRQVLPGMEDMDGFYYARLQKSNE